MKKIILSLLVSTLLFLCSCTTIEYEHESSEKTFKEQSYALLVNVTDKDYTVKIDSPIKSSFQTINKHSMVEIKDVYSGADLQVYDTAIGEWRTSTIPNASITSVEENFIKATVPVITLENETIVLADTWEKPFIRGLIIDNESSESENELTVDKAKPNGALSFLLLGSSAVLLILLAATAGM